MDDAELLRRISALVEEEHKLERAGHARHDAAVELRLRDLEVALDQAWDLLRQRRARRDFGNDPEFGTERSASTVEGYQQ